MQNLELKDFSSAELRQIVRSMQDQISQKDRQITHLTQNAQKWVKKFDQHQSLVADMVIKQFELEFEQERSELQAKIGQLSQLNQRLLVRYHRLARSVSQAAQVKNKSLDEILDDELASEKELSVNLEPMSVSEIELPKEMSEQLAKYMT